MKKYSLILIITAAVIIEAMGAAQYFLARNGAKQEVLTKANRDMAESQRVAASKAEVESAVRNIEESIREELDTLEGCYQVLSRLIHLNPHIVGAGVAFIPNYYKDQGQGRLFAPYAYDDQPSVVSEGKKREKPHVQTRLLSFDYTQREWYKGATEIGISLWTRPYVDEGGPGILMCSYAMPVKDKNGKTAGVLFADVPMEDATVLLNDMYGGIQSRGMYIVGLQIVSLLLLGFIIWRAIAASRRYKEQFIDPEKDHLAEQVKKLKEVNRRLTERNMELARKIQAGPQQSDAHWFG